MVCNHMLEIGILKKGEIIGWQCHCGKSSVTANTADMPAPIKEAAPKSRIRVKLQKGATRTFRKKK